MLKTEKTLARFLTFALAFAASSIIIAFANYINVAAYSSQNTTYHLYYVYEGQTPSAALNWTNPHLPLYNDGTPAQNGVLGLAVENGGYTQNGLKADAHLHEDYKIRDGSYSQFGVSDIYLAFGDERLRVNGPSAGYNEAQGTLDYYVRIPSGYDLSEAEFESVPLPIGHALVSATADQNGIVVVMKAIPISLEDKWFSLYQDSSGKIMTIERLGTHGVLIKIEAAGGHKRSASSVEWTEYPAIELRIETMDHTIAKTIYDLEYTAADGTVYSFTWHEGVSTFNIQTKIKVSGSDGVIENNYTWQSLLQHLPPVVPATAPLAAGGYIGDALYTDIKGIISYCPVPVVVADGKTLVAADDLRYYGFSVTWDETTRSIAVELNPEGAFMPLNDEVQTGAALAGTVKCPCYQTDIKTYLSGELTECFTADGKIYIEFERLGKYGQVDWDGSYRTLQLSID